jgi:hypothetical protein
VISLIEKKDGVTLLRITPENPVVLFGTRCCGPHGDYANEIVVDPTTIEEYTLIKYIAEQLNYEIPPIEKETINVP